MKVADHNLADALRLFSPAERKAVDEHLRGVVTAESRELMRAIRRRLKRRARSKPPAKLKWLM